MDEGAPFDGRSPRRTEVRKRTLSTRRKMAAVPYRGLAPDAVAAAVVVVVDVSCNDIKKYSVLIVTYDGYCFLHAVGA